MSRIRSHLSYANVTASLALFVALGGTSYAVTQLPRNSVGSKQIRTGAVGASEVRTGAVRSRDIGNRSVALRDISLGARRSLRGQQGPTGPQGPAGPGAASLSAARALGRQFLPQPGDSGPGVRPSAPRRRLQSRLQPRRIARAYAVATINGNASGQIAAETSTATPARRAASTSRRATRAGHLSDLPFHLIVSC